MMNRKRSAQQQWRLAELERKAQADVERVLKMDEGNGRGL
jgi:hypothetical protein